MLLGGRYELGELIARGGMADVHAAVDTRLGRDVAVKLMRAGSDAAAGDLRARFDDEARLAASLVHPNIVAVYDSGEDDDGRPYIVMERLPGETLGDRIAAGPMDGPVVERIADDVLAGLGAAHAAGVVHRDIKPANILMDADGHAKIADFGIARESDGLMVDPTSTNALTGTPAYLAPERIEGAPATPRSDIWSVGVVLYAALAGKKPFDAPTPLAVAMAVRDDDPPPLAEVAPGTDAALIAAIERAMAKDPASRYATAGEMALALHGDATVVDAVPDATVALRAPAIAAAAPWRRPAVVYALAAAAVVLLVLVGVAAGHSGGGAPPANATVTSTTAVVTTTSSTTPTTLAVVNDQGPAQAPEGRHHKGKGHKGG